MAESRPDKEEQSIRKALNDAKKLELTQKYGAKFWEYPSELPPEIESQWLNSIEEFERNFEAAPQLSVRTLLGFPSFKPLEEIPTELLESELDRILEMLFRHGIVVDCVAEVTAEDFYRFITTELMNEEVDDIHIEGMKQCFIYEDFHPNDEYDARNAADNFLSDLFGKFEEGLLIDLSRDEFCNSKGVHLGREEIQASIRNFCSSYAAFTHHAFECVKCTLEGESAEATMQGMWTALKTGSLEAVSFEGECMVKMTRSPYGGYDVIQFSLPGFED